MVTMTDINPTAAIARETARTTTGQFGTQEHSTPEIALAGPYKPGQPVYAKVTFEEYASEHDEYPIQTATQKVDIVGVLDTLPLDQIQSLRDDPYAHHDDIGYALQASGEFTHPAHPFQLDLDRGDLDAYADHREIHGQIEPVADKVVPAVENLLAARTQRQADIAALQEQLAEQVELKEKAEESILRSIASKYHPAAVRATFQLDHPRYPVELWDDASAWIDLGPEKEQEIVDEVRRTLGEDPGVVGGRGTARLVDLRE